MFESRTSNIIKKRRLREKINRILKPVIILVLFVALIGVSYHLIRRSGSGEYLPGSALVAEVAKAIDDGNYALAKTRIEEGLRKTPNDSEMNKMRLLLTEDLEIDFKFNYLPGRRRQITTREISDQVVLTREDPYYLIVHSSDKCFLYIFQLQSSGELARLFPNSRYVPTSNPVPGGPIRIPDGYEWFYLDDTPGTEMIYLVGSRWRQKILEELCAQLESEDRVNEKAEIIRKILSRLEREEQATESIPGLVFAKHQFRHEKASR